MTTIMMMRGTVNSPILFLPSNSGLADFSCPVFSAKTLYILGTDLIL